MQNAKFLLILLMFTTLCRAQQKSDDRALSIIRKAVASKAVNDPQRQLESFRFKAYNKLLITARPDSIEGRIDSVFLFKKRRKQLIKIDSSDYRFKKVITRQHLFQMEKASVFSYAGHHLKEDIPGIRMSGFKRPVYDIVEYTMPSFSVYNSRYVLLGTKYKSPLSVTGERTYEYQLVDSTSINGRKTFIIDFHNKNKRRSSGLTGTIFIDSQNYAIAKAEFRQHGVLNITATHNFKYLKEENLWFPTGTEMLIRKGKNDDDIHILGATFIFDAEDGTKLRPRKKVASDFAYLLSKTDYSDFAFNVPVKVRQPAINAVVSDDAENRPEIFWRNQRTDSLDVRGKNTYAANDSISRRNRINERLFLGRRIINGYVPFGFIDLDLLYLINFNNFEGFRFGFGGRTNDKLSRKFRVEGYFANSTKDVNNKFSLGIKFRVGHHSDTWIGASFTDDIREIGSIVFATDPRRQKVFSGRPVNVSTFYGYHTGRIYIQSKLVPGTESNCEFLVSNIEPKFGYAFQYRDRVYEDFQIAAALAAFEWNPFSSYLQTPNERLETTKGFPRFSFQFVQTLPGIAANDFKFTKLDFRAEYERTHLNRQKTALLFQAGYASGDVPLTNLYSLSPNSKIKDAVLQRINFGGKTRFETMYFNEFFSSRYVLFQARHTFRRIPLVRKIGFQPTLVTRYAYGDMAHPEQHLGIVFKTLDKGYTESGIEFNRIYKVIGLSAFYRYGANHLPQFEDNIAVKVTVVLNFF